MPVPQEIRDVPRPVNTVVTDTKSNTTFRYAVRERNGTQYVKGGNPKPINGKIIGYIIDGKFIVKEEKEKKSIFPPSLSFGGATFAHSLSRDIFHDLLDTFPIKEAQMIMTIALVEIIRPNTPITRIKEEYEDSYLSLYYPKVTLSKNVISSFYKTIGKMERQRRNFASLRASHVLENHHLIIDGMLVQDTSKINDLSHLSYKSNLHPRKDINIIYAYDLEKEEPVCAEVFMGNSIDSSCYRDFILHNEINKGIIIADKGFSIREIDDLLRFRPLIHYLSPLKNNDHKISQYKMLEFEGKLPGKDETILFKKTKIKGGKILYSFRHTDKAQESESHYLNKIDEHNFNPYDYLNHILSFGTIVFISDLDLDPSLAYKLYLSRWELELVFKRYKNELCNDKTNVHSSFSVKGKDFVNFISTLVTCRMIKKGKEKGILSQMTYQEMINDLNRAWRSSEVKKHKYNDQYWDNTNKRSKDLLLTLGLLDDCIVKEKRKRGRPKKSENH